MTVDNQIKVNLNKKPVLPILWKVLKENAQYMVLATRLD
jgi:hypothetical protein